MYFILPFLYLQLYITLCYPAVITSRLQLFKRKNVNNNKDDAIQILTIAKINTIFITPTNAEGRFHGRALVIITPFSSYRLRTHISKEKAVIL